MELETKLATLDPKDLQTANKEALNQILLLKNKVAYYESISRGGESDDSLESLEKDPPPQHELDKIVKSRKPPILFDDQQDLKVDQQNKSSTDDADCFWTTDRAKQLRTRIKEMEKELVLTPWCSAATTMLMQIMTAKNDDRKS